MANEIELKNKITNCDEFIKMVKAAKNLYALVASISYVKHKAEKQLDNLYKQRELNKKGK